MRLLNSYIKSLQAVLAIVLLLAAVQLIVWLLPSLHVLKGLSGYVPLHTILETTAIIISIMVFAVGWGAHNENQPANSILLASVFFGVGLLDLLHTLAYQGMPDFITPSGPEKAINFWLMARLLSALGLLALTWFSWKKTISNRGRWLVLTTVLFFVTVSSIIGFKHPQFIPNTFIAGLGLTNFKLNVEFFIITLYIFAAFRFLVLMRTKQDFDVVNLFGAASVMALSEIYFTLYADVTDIFNLLGHIYKVIAYGFIYKSIFLITIREPYLKLSESKKLLQTVIDNIPLRVFWKNRDSMYLGCNIAFSKDAGESSPKDIINKFDTQLIWSDKAESYLDDDLYVIKSNTSKLNFEESLTLSDGSQIWLRTSKVPLLGSGKESIGILGIYENITQQRKLERDLKMAYSAIENSKNAHFWVSAQGQVTYANAFACKSLGYSCNELIGMYVWDFDPDYPPSAQSQFWTNIKQDGVFASESRHKRKDGTIFPVDVTANYIFAGDVEQVFCVVHDISKRKQTEEIVWFNANFDDLTGLQNRRMFQVRLEQEIKNAQRTGFSLALLFLDLDNFKEINDTMGHAQGDILLKETAKRLTSCVRESDVVARFGGDEFTILLNDLHNFNDVDRVAALILQKLSEPFVLDSEIHYMTASIGVTIYPDDGTDIETLLKNADQAMYAAKAGGRNRYNYFTQAMQATAQARMRLANDLRCALPDNQLWVAYQPIVDLKTGKIIKAEALVRWQHPKHGLVSPAEFIPIAEHTGLINDIGEFVFHQAALQVKRWQEVYDSEFQISVNVSPVQFSDKNREYKPLHKQLKKLGLSGKSIVVEITEGLLLEANASIKEKLLEFRDAGIQVALDDFGTGYSSLSYLKKFDIDYIKIDQSFVRNLRPNSDDFALCEAMIVMANKLGLKVIAEGVETVEQRDLLTKMDCDYVQGYLFSRPVPADEFERLLKIV